MKLKSNIQLKQTCGINVLIIPGKQMTMVRLNETSSFLWQAFANGKEFTLNDMVNALTNEYDIDNETATNDISTLVNQWNEAGLLE